MILGPNSIPNPNPQNPIQILIPEFELHIIAAHHFDQKFEAQHSNKW